MKKPVWVQRDVVLAVHDMVLAEFGGTEGVRDYGLLDSALARPEHRFAYGSPTIFDLAAAYAYGVGHNHPFVDGNKRTGFTIAVVFLEINGRNFVASEVDATIQTLGLASHDISEKKYAAWLKTNTE